MANYDQSEFSELSHIDWVVDHINDYRFPPDLVPLREKIMHDIQMRNVVYTNLKEEYDEFCARFDNRPFNYMTELESDTGNFITSDKRVCYLVDWTVTDRTSGKEMCFRVPIGYMEERQAEAADDEDRLRYLTQTLYAEDRSACRLIMDKLTRFIRDAVINLDRNADLEAQIKRWKPAHMKDVITIFILWLLFGTAFKGRLTPIGGLFGKIGLALAVIVAGILIWNTVRIYKMDIVLNKMTWANALAKKLRAMNTKSVIPLQALLKEENAGIFSKETLNKTVKTDELLQLLETSKRYGSYRFPKNVRPEDYERTFMRGKTHWVVLCVLGIIAASLLRGL